MNPVGPDYGARMRRAMRLAEEYPFAAEVLTFYRQLAAFQQKLYAEIPGTWDSQSAARADGQLRRELNFDAVLPHFPELLSLVERAGPLPVVEAARRLSAQEPAQWLMRLSDFWMFGGRSNNSDREAPHDAEEPLMRFILQAFLQPCSEFLAAHMSQRYLESGARVCPRCGAAPLLGVLRPEGDGGRRCLLCSFCLQEWNFRRILCPACGEEAEANLPVYVAEQFPHIRMETCDTCKFYLRTVDLTKNGHAIPIVDDLAAIPLSLWADEHGYSRLQVNLLGT